MEAQTLEDIIRQYVHLPPVPAGTGWYPVLHTTCDHGKKGPRAGFRFDQGTVAFHCFNCPLKAVFDPAEHDEMPENMIRVLNDFNIPEEQWQQVLFNSLKLKDAGKLKRHHSEQIKVAEPPELPLPKTFYSLKDAPSDDKWAEIARDYLTYKRAVDPDSYPFMLSKPTNDPVLKKWFGRVIIPIYKDNKLIFYTGRDLTEKQKKKYESPAVSRTNVLFGFDKLFHHYDHPLYIVEGWFDAYAIDGIGVMGNEISKEKAAWINKSPRKKVYVPDRFGSGSQAARQALEYGWYISTPEIGSCKDLSDAVKQYGKLYVLKTLAEHTSTDFEARVKLGLFCED